MPRKKKSDRTYDGVPVYTFGKGKHAFDYIRVCETPEKERARLEKFLDGQTRPMIDGLDIDKQDAVFFSDYLDFLEGLQGRPVPWD